MRTIKSFEVNIDHLSDKEKQVISKLYKVCEIIGSIFEQQVSADCEGANFYPCDATKKEIEEAFKKDPAILDPYTMVERNGKGGLKAIPYHVKFKKELKEASGLLNEAAKISEDKEFGQYLKDVAQALSRSDYGEVEILWITRGPFKITFMAGPVEKYFDRLFFKKCSYQSWVGILDQQRMKEAEEFKTIILNSKRKVLANIVAAASPDLKTEINTTLCSGGQKAYSLPSGTNLPEDGEIMKKYGAKFAIFISPLRLNFDQKELPIFKKVFTPGVQSYFSEKDLQLGLLRCILLHETSHTLIKYQDSKQRLKELFPIFDELLAYILGIRCCNLLLLKGVLNQKEVEAIMTTFLIRNFRYWLDAKTNPGRLNYSIGGAIAHNFFLEEGSLIREENGLRPDFTKLFMSIDHLSRLVEYYLGLGTYEEAKSFIDEYGSFENLQKFEERLKDISK